MQGEIPGPNASPRGAFKASELTSPLQAFLGSFPAEAALDLPGGKHSRHSTVCLTASSLDTQAAVLTTLSLNFLIYKIKSSFYLH